MFLIRKASDDYWFDFEDKTNVIKLYEIYKEFIFRKNYFYGETTEYIMEFWDGLSLDNAKKISKCKYEILIYDSWVE